MKKVAYIASECVPFIKTGGLADVVGTLPKKYLTEMNMMFGLSCQTIFVFQINTEKKCSI